MNDLEHVDDFWRQKIAEADAAGGSVDIRLGDIPKVPGVAYAMPGNRVGRKITLDGRNQAVTEHTPDVVMTLIVGPQS